MAPRLPLRCWAPIQRTVAQLLGHDHHAISSPIAVSRTSKRGIKYGWTTFPRRNPRPEKYNALTPGLPPPTTGNAAAAKRKERTTPLRTGVLAVKKGMTAFYTKRGTRIPCTVLQLDSVQVVAARTFSRHGYWAVQVGAGARKPQTAGAPLLGYFEAKGLPPKQHLAEFRVRSHEGLLPVGALLQPDWFHLGQWVDVRSHTRGMGFAGGMKRHGFAGQGKSHGNSLNHRTMGSVGPSQGSGSRVLPGKKMPGRMGGQRVTVQNLAVLKVDNEMGIVVVKGAVGGPRGCLVQIQDAVKKPPPSHEFVEESAQLLLERSPDAVEQLKAARLRHLELKAMRKEGRIGELVVGSMTAGIDGGEAAAPPVTATTI